jgi:CBS domain containing-hemolysin-like protein
MVSIDASLPLDEIVRIVASSPFTSMPVWRDRPSNIVGLLRTKDVALKYVSQDAARSGGGIDGLVRPIAHVPLSMPADRLLGFLRERRTQVALVDADGGPAGLVTLQDVISELLGHADGTA